MREAAGAEQGSREQRRERQQQSRRRAAGEGGYGAGEASPGPTTAPTRGILASRAVDRAVRSGLAVGSFGKPRPGGGGGGLSRR